MTARRRERQQGAALVIVLMLGLLAVALVTAMMTFASTSTPLARNDQNWTGSLGAAEAGVDEYLYRLSKDSTYWQAPQVGGPGGNDAFTASGVPVPGGDTEAKFSYNVVPPSVTGNGTIKLTVTGKLRNSSRKIQATLRRQSFLDFLYFSDFETSDPLSYPTTATSPGSGLPARTRAWADANCKDRWFYATTSSLARPNFSDNRRNCLDIIWSSNDVLNGPLHSNDAIKVSGSPDFNDEVTTNWPKAKIPSTPSVPSTYHWYDYQCSGCSSPQWKPGQVDPPSYKDRLTVPPDNLKLLEIAQTDGCVYTGPTSIKLKVGTGAIKRTWDVVSPGTPVTAKCGPGTNITGGTNFNGVVYVTKKSGACTYGPINGKPYPPGLPVPIALDITVYDCVEGDAFVEGTLDGQMTIGASNNIIITKNLDHQNTTSASDDVLGLITQNFIELIHPVKTCSSGANCVNGGENITTPAATHWTRMRSFAQPCCQSNTRSEFETTTRASRSGRRVATSSRSAERLHRSTVVRS